MGLQDETFTKKTKNRPITLAYVSSGTDKTTALHCGLAVVTTEEFCFFFHKVTPAKALELCCIASIPKEHDDPDI